MVLASRKLPYTYQQLYHALSQQPSHNQEGVDGDGMSTHLGEDEKDSEEAVVGVVEEAVEEKAKEI